MAISAISQDKSYYFFQQQTLIHIRRTFKHITEPYGMGKSVWAIQPVSKVTKTQFNDYKWFKGDQGLVCSVKRGTH